MAPPLRQLMPARPAVRRPGWLALAPMLTVLACLAPIAAGLVGMTLPAFGWLPALGGHSLSLGPWRALLAQPELPGSLARTVCIGFAATVLAVLLVLGFAATGHDRPLYHRLNRLLAPLLAMPHAALAIGLAFLLAPSGWIARLISPWATGWQQPPDLMTDGDPYGAVLVLGLLLKEVPYLMLMLLGALDQVQPQGSLMVARTLGYSPAAAWLKTVLPRVYPQLRLPIFAVLAYSLSTVDMALVLGPTGPPPLAVLVLRWTNDPDLERRFLAAAGATLQFLVVAGAILAWMAGERLARRLGRGRLFDGRRGGSHAGRRPFGAAVATLWALAGAAILVLALWSLAQRWRFPDALPGRWTLANWLGQSDRLGAAATTTLALGLAATAIALALTVGCLEHEERRGLRPGFRALWLLYLPLLAPQVSFMFGAQTLLVMGRLDGAWPALLWSHLLYVLPYVFLGLGDPYRALDPRYARAARALGASSLRILWAVKLPMLLRPVLFAAAVGFSVSVALYVPTVMAGAGRSVTLASEAIALTSGADRRVIGVYAFLQAGLPLAAFALAFVLPAWRRPAFAEAKRRLRAGRRAMGRGSGP